METCKDCIHFEICSDFYDDTIECSKPCTHFKNRSRFVELPCKVVERYYIDIDQAKTVSDMLLTISQNFEYNGDNSSAFKSYFIGVGDAIESCLKVLTPFWKEKK